MQDVMVPGARTGGDQSTVLTVLLRIEPGFRIKLVATGQYSLRIFFNIINVDISIEIEIGMSA